jgi:bacteriocin biosynthesis cyclodehydratase domain-containing protein
VTVDGGPPAELVGGPWYRLRPSVETFRDRRGVLCFVRPGEADLVVHDPDHIDVALVRRLAKGWATTAALARELCADPAVVENKLDALIDATLVLERGPAGAPPLKADEAERFSRQLPYLAELGDEVLLQRRLRNSTVVVLGCGGLGTWAVASLACIGVGRVVLVDDDEVALSNLNRQILYTTHDIGVPKVAASSRWLSAFDPAVEVTTLEQRIRGSAELEPIVAAADAVILVADSPPYDIARWVNTACVTTRTPFIVAGQLPPVLKVGPTYVPGAGACFTCHERALTRVSWAYQDYVAFRASDTSIPSTVGPASCVAGGLIGLEVMHLLISERPATQELALIVHMRTLEVRRERVDRDPECETCKHLGGADGGSTR